MPNVARDAVNHSLVLQGSIQLSGSVSLFFYLVSVCPWSCPMYRSKSVVSVCVSVCVCRRSDVWTTPPHGTAGRGAAGGGSLSSSVGKIGSDDDMSLNDYASLTPGKFTEDGSFIGQYNPAMKWKASSQPPPSYDQSHA